MKPKVLILSIYWDWGWGDPVPAAGQTCRLLSWEWSALLHGHLTSTATEKRNLSLYSLEPAREQVQMEQFIKKATKSLFFCYTSIGLPSVTGTSMVPSGKTL